MKVLDYEQVNGDQDKDATAVLPPSRSKHHRHQQEPNHEDDHEPERQQTQSRHRLARRPLLNNDNMSSYMHGGHIPSHLGGGRTLVDESRPSSGETAVTENQHMNVPAVDDLTVPEQRKLSLPERMVQTDGGQYCSNEVRLVHIRIHC